MYDMMRRLLLYTPLNDDDTTRVNDVCDCIERSTVDPPWSIRPTAIPQSFRFTAALNRFTPYTVVLRSSHSSGYLGSTG